MFKYIVIFLFILLGSFSVKAQEPVKSPFNMALTPSLQHEAEDFNCVAAPKPIVNIKFSKAYGSKEDKDNLAVGKQSYAYIEDTSILVQYEASISDMANIYKASSGKPKEKVAECLLEWLNVWAKGNALLGEVNDVGRLVRKWSLASISSSYAQILNYKYLDSNKDVRIKKWIKRISYQVKSDFSKKSDNVSLRNNHLYWAAWALGISGYVLQDGSLFNWAMDKMDFAISQIQENGVLPLELKRKKMALHYHAYSLGPLVMLADLALKNGYKDYYNYNNRALHRSVFLVMRSLNDNSYFNKISGYKQNLDRTVTPANLAWLEVYNKIYPSSEGYTLLNRLRPMKQKRLGG